MIFEKREFGKAYVTLDGSSSIGLQVKVNWYSLGAQNVDKAREFQNNLCEAVAFATSLQSAIIRKKKPKELVLMMKKN